MAGRSSEERAMWTGWRGGEPRPAVDEASSDDGVVGSEFQTWHVWHADAPEPRQRVRRLDGVAVSDWQRGPDFATALRQAEEQGWRVYDTEPGNEPGEHAIVHLKRGVAR